MVASPGSSLWERFLNFKPLAPLMSSVKLDSPEARDLHTVCRLYHVCLKTFVPIKMDILTGTFLLPVFEKKSLHCSVAPVCSTLL